MLTWAKIVELVLRIGSWFQRRAEADRNIQAGRNQRDAETLVKIEKGRAARELADNDAEYAGLLLKELGLGSRGNSDDGQLLSELRDRMSQEPGSLRYGSGHIEKLCNIPGVVYGYSSTSLRKLSTCQYELQLVGLELTKEQDCTVVCGTRSMADQQISFDSGASKLPPGRSLHNRTPSDAFDIVPAEAPRLWAIGKDLPSGEYYAFAERVFKIASRYRIELRWGGDWDGDKDYSDQSFNDFAHFERKI